MSCILLAVSEGRKLVEANGRLNTARDEDRARQREAEARADRLRAELTDAQHAVADKPDAAGGVRAVAAGVAVPRVYAAAVSAWHNGAGAGS